MGAKSAHRDSAPLRVLPNLRDLKTGQKTLSHKQKPNPKS
jgi:hypothetical protein